jgi:tannase
MALMNIAITIDSDSVVAIPRKNVSIQGNVVYPDTVIDFCDVTFAYTHTGRGDMVQARYWMPAPDSFQNRYLSTGGGGFAINSGNQSLPGGVQYGAVAGATDGGFGNFSINLDKVWLLENGTENWEALYMFGYHAIHELTLLGKLLTSEYYNMSGTRLYSYYQGCSEGGRDGWSQVQRFASFDGVITGAPAFRFAHQQVQHLWSNVVEHTLGYYPPPCELEKILNETIAFCDRLDGKTDGVVARTDLCKLQFDINSTIGTSYSCPARTPTVFGTWAAPAQSGIVTADGAVVARLVIDGIRDSQGRRAYFSYQPSSSFYDAVTQANPETVNFELSINAMGGEYVAQFLQLLNETNLPNLDGVTYDTLVKWINQGWQMYEESLQTTCPDLSTYQASDRKILHYHGESDFSIPTASSVHYYESVRHSMYPGTSFNKSGQMLSDWYRLFLIPGASHCAANLAQPNPPFPQTNLAVLIDWVEHGTAPDTLNATVLLGEHMGENAQVCAWPLRPFWSTNGTTMECRYDQESIDTWLYDLDAFKVPVY